MQRYRCNSGFPTNDGTGSYVKHDEAERELQKLRDKLTTADEVGRMYYEQAEKHAAELARVETALAAMTAERDEMDNRVHIARTTIRNYQNIARELKDERDARDVAIRVLAEYGGAAHGVGGPFKCWDSRRTIDAFDAVLADPTASAAIWKAAKKDARAAVEGER